MAEPLRLSLACGDYDRTRALHAGRVATPGLELHCTALPASETFVRMTRDEEFDVAELSASMYAIGLSRGDDRFVALPVFPLRAFRHRDIYVGAGSGIRDPGELRGQRVGVRHFHMTSAVWQRGLLSDDWDLRADELRWVRAELFAPGPVPPRLTLRLPESVELRTDRGSSLVDLIASGAVAAGLLAAPVRHAGLRRLFNDPQALETQYFRRAGCPIMHLIVVRRALLAGHPELAPALLAAFEAAKQVGYAEAVSASSPSMLPFASLELERARAAFGEDLYPYGLDAANLVTLETLRRYLREQHLAPNVPPVLEWFEDVERPSPEPVPAGFTEIDD